MTDVITVQETQIVTVSEKEVHVVTAFIQGPRGPKGEDGDAGSGGGVTDHGALSGLGDDDHSQYHNDVRGDARYYTKSQINAEFNAVSLALANKANTAHGHSISDVSGLQSALDGKQPTGSYAPASHAHPIGDITGLQTVLDGKQDAGSYAASTHSHAIADVNGLQAALDAKQAAGSYAPASHTHTASDVSGLAAVATSGSYNDLSNKPAIPTQYADANARAAISLTTTGSGAASYNNTNGVLNIPTPAAGSVSPLTTKGDIYIRSSTADARLGIGPNGGRLTPDSAKTNGLRWDAPIVNPQYAAIVESDFLETLNRSPWKASTFNANVSDNSSSIDGFLGTVSIDNGGNQFGAGLLQTNNSSDFRIRTDVTGRYLLSRSRFYTNTLPTSGEDFHWFSGLTSFTSAGGEPIAAGSQIGLIGNSSSANWRLLKRVGGSNTYIDTGIAMANNTIYNFDVEVIGNSTAANTVMNAYINGVLVGSLTGFDATVMTPCPALMKKFAGTGTRQWYVDYAGFGVYGVR